MTETHLLLGQTLSFNDDPFKSSPAAAARHLTRGAVLLRDGKIADAGDAERLTANYPGAERRDYGRDLIMAGFVDAHAHFPQTAIIASWEKGLLDWLNSHTFPEEAKFGDRGYASDIARRYLKLLIANGTTTVCSFCTTHPESVDAIFEEAERLGMRALAGKVCMDRNAPPDLLDTAAASYDESKRLLEKWHGRNRLSYVISPRFALTSSTEQLFVLGSLWSEFPDCLMQTHLSEQTEEIEAVKRLFPEARDYLDVYENCGLVGERGLYGHAIHLTARERRRLLASGGALIHCPTSNLFIGSGLFDTAGLKSEGQTVGLATDTGGGSSYSMLRTMAAAYEISQLNGSRLHPAHLIWLATAANADALHLRSEIGGLEPGSEADITVLDLRSTEAIAARAERAEDIWEELFPTVMMGDDRAVRAVWIGGRQAKPG